MRRYLCIALITVFSLQFCGCGKNNEKIALLQSEVSSLQSRAAKQESTIEELRQQIEDLQSRMDDLESAIYEDQYDDGTFAPIALKRRY